jgi:hypothetical protein
MGDEFSLNVARRGDRLFRNNRKMFDIDRIDKGFVFGNALLHLRFF